MWNKDHSLQLSLWAIRIFFVLWIGFCVFGYFIVKAYVAYNHVYEALEAILITLYLCLAAAIFLLFDLYKLLTNIKHEKIFIHDNVDCLRRISWLCLMVGVITLISTLQYPPFILVSVSFAFIALIVRVVKNVIEQAISIKEENDFTI